MRKRRKAFTLVEVVVCALILSLVTIGAVSVSSQINALKSSSQNTVYLTLHNLNCMEQLRQMSYDLANGVELFSHYGPDVFGTSKIDTDVYLDMAKMGEFRVYSVRIQSSMKDYNDSLVNTYVFTSIGRYQNSSDVENEDSGSLVLE